MKRILYFLLDQWADFEAAYPVYRRYDDRRRTI